MGKLSVDLKAIWGHVIVCLIVKDLFFKVLDLCAVFLLKEVGGFFLDFDGAE